MKKLLLLTLAIVALLLTNVNAQQVATVKDGDKCPAFEFTDMDGKKVTLKDFKGNYVYIDLWATWCTACHGEVGDFEKLENEFKGKKIKFISISIDKNIDAWKKWVVDRSLTGTQLHIGNSPDFMKEFNIRAIPRFIILGKKGEVIRSEAYRPTLGEKTSNFIKNLKGL